jgi:Uncharacterized ACR, COG1678
MNQVSHKLTLSLKETNQCFLFAYRIPSLPFATGVTLGISHPRSMTNAKFSFCVSVLAAVAALADGYVGYKIRAPQLDPTPDLIITLSGRGLSQHLTLNQRHFHFRPLFQEGGSSQSFSSESIKFLGKGPEAIVRPGVVLLAPAEEYHHFLRQAAVFVYAMGENDDGDYLIRGVILDQPTPFRIGEMMPTKQSDGVYNNLIFRGGDVGPTDEKEGAFCIHSFPDLGREEIGTSGIYQGGDLSQMSDPSAVKFFFNYMEFTEQELEQMLEVRHKDGDAWTSVEVPKNTVLSNDYDRGDAWSRLRNAIREQIR